MKPARVEEPWKPAQKTAFVEESVHAEELVKSRGPKSVSRSWLCGGNFPRAGDACVICCCVHRSSDCEIAEGSCRLLLSSEAAWRSSRSLQTESLKRREPSES